MDKNRLWIAGIVVAIVVVGLGGWFLGIAPVIQQSSNARSEKLSLETSNGASQARVAELKTKFANIAALSAKLDDLNDSVPTVADIPVFLREVNALTVSADVTLGTVSIGDAQSYVPPASTATASDASSAAATPSPSPSATATVAPTVTGPGARLVQIPVTVTVSGTYPNVMTFTGGVQNGARLYLVNSLNVVQAGDASTEFTATIGGFVYVLPAAK
jgi:Tfp pilus assembly protein PilO